MHYEKLQSRKLQAAAVAVQQRNHHINQQAVAQASQGASQQTTVASQEQREVQILTSEPGEHLKKPQRQPNNHQQIGLDLTSISQQKPYAQQTKQHDAAYYANYTYDGGTQQQHK